MIVDHRGHAFQIVEGRTHPQYSIDTFTADEKPFREQYWDVQLGDVVVDAGASYGAYALSAAASGASFVVALEPEPSVFVDLVRNAEANDWHYQKSTGEGFRAKACGLWDSECMLSMKTYAPHWPQQTITTDYEMISLDGWFWRTRLDWLKLDVEGAEVRALTGAKRTLAKFKPKCIIEVHQFLSPDLLPQCRAILDECGIPGIVEVPRPGGDKVVMLVSHQ